MQPQQNLGWLLRGPTSDLGHYFKHLTVAPLAGTTLSLTRSSRLGVRCFATVTWVVLLIN